MRKWGMLLAMAAFVFVTFSATEARAQLMFGPQLTLIEFDNLGIGVRGDYALGDVLGLEEEFLEHMKVSADANYIIDDSEFTTLLFNVNGLVPFDVEADFVPYAGAGLNHRRWSLDGERSTASGLNLLGGVMFGLAEFPAFGQAQYSTSGGGFITISFGVFFGG